MSRRRCIAAWMFCVLAFASLSASADELPALVKIRLKGGRTIVGELIAQSRASLKVRELKTGKEAD